MDLYHAAESLWKVKYKDCTDRTKKAAVYETVIHKIQEVNPEGSRDSVVKSLTV
jgi:hypothetical protein